MPRCPSCGSENPEGFRFCGACGTPLSAVADRETRKTVTVVFCDVAGSTTLGERLDPESLRRVMARYFEAMRAAVERHGGIVEKFIGDAVMAVFGIPQAREDDALRAVRAAAGMRAALSGLNTGLERDHGVRIELRIGVNTGEVVTGTAERLATGDAVNLAARLEQACPPGSVLLGGETLRLVRHGVVTQPVAPLTVRGKAEPVEAHVLVEVDPDAVATPRNLETAMVGRERERRLLEDALARRIEERSCGLFTILGPAGIGKSRLVSEFLRRAGATVAAGRCLPYGEGITYWPVVEVVRGLVDTAGGAGLAGLVPDARARAALESLLSDVGPAARSEDIADAVRDLVVATGRRAPLVIVFDDIHWGEETFLDLVEHLADWALDAPVLLVCMARPELLEKRPTWGGGKLNATSILLEPLDAGETDELIAQLAGDLSLAEAGLRDRIRTGAGGNPLFLEEMLAVLRSGSDSDVTVPPTIQALLAARLDQLGGAERSVLERGAIEGQSFHRGAAEALSAEPDGVRPALLRLTRTEILRAEPAVIAGEDGFRFRHLLIRDAAYDSLPKAVRADLHERFASWLDDHGATLIERDEIVGYHLEQAARYRDELGPPTPESRAIAAAAADRLAAAGRRAIERSDMGAARNLLGRAIALWPPDQVDVELELKLCHALLMSGAPVEAVTQAKRTALRARAAGSRLGELHALLELERFSSQVDPDGYVNAVEELLAEARPLFEAERYDAGLVALWMAIASVEHNRCRFDAAAAAHEAAIEAARRAGDRQIEHVIMPGFVAQTVLGSMPIPEILELLDRLESRYGRRPYILANRATAYALTGRIEEARAMHADAVRILGEHGAVTVGAITAQLGWQLETLAGEDEAAAREARHGCDVLEEMGERAWLSTLAAGLADSLYRLGRDAEAADWAERGLALGGADDVITQMLARQVLAKVAAQRGEFAEAERLATEAVHLAGPTQSPVSEADALVDLADVMALAGEHARATAELERAAAIYEHKGATVPLARVQERLAAS